MAEHQTLEILKQAILLERRGHAFYRQVASSAKNEEVQQFFQTMADEEKQHMKILADHFRAYRENGSFGDGAFDPESASGVDAMVLSDETKAGIAAAGFEAAAVSAAMFMEEKAIRLYRERGASAQDPSEQALYRWLAQWEGEHLAFLARLERDLTERIWNDNSFWPF